ncbi:hypothetical protein BVY04_02300 [bacterium M21]|nr:hypothetical protein BVY04_02300 [bacterium M21]
MDLSRLNEPQREAVLHVEGPLLVLAGAGTGKTTVITFRICKMLENGIKPENILGVTFTNKAAKEMEERLHKLLPWLKRGQLTMSTFHSFCCRVLRRHAKKLGYNNNFGIADEGDTTDIIREIIIDRHIKNKELNTPYFISAISNAKNDLKEPAELRASKRSFLQVVGEVYQYYEERLRQMNLIDFDDLLRLVVKLFEQEPKVLKAYQDKFQYIMVDEYQDTNHCQAKLLNFLTGTRYNLAVVGDDDQSIYGWRGADIANILDFPNRYPNTTVIKLEENYRSTNIILRAANEVIACNTKRHGKALWSGQENGDLITLIEAEDGDKEAEYTADVLRAYNVDKKIPYSDMAILYRSNHLSRRMEQSLRKRTIPYRIVGSKAFYERREIKDAAGYLRIIANPMDELAFRRIINVPPRGIGTKCMEKIEACSQSKKCTMLAALRDDELRKLLSPKVKGEIDHFLAAYDTAALKFATPGNLAENINEFLNDVGYVGGLKKIYKKHEESLTRQENVLEFIDSALSFNEKALLDFLEINSLTDAQDRVNDKNDDDEGGVTLMTVHASKGLEFPLTVIVGLEQNLFPHERSLSEGGVDEERRLFYVAVTRAKKHLFLTRAIKRQTFGKQGHTRPSQFLIELPPDLVERADMKTFFKPASQEQVAATFDMLMNRYGGDS